MLLPFGKSANDYFIRVIFSLSISMALSKIVSISQVGILECFFEVIFGLLLSLPIVFLIETLSLVGEYFDVGRGLNIGSFYDPFFASNISVSAKFLRLATWVLILFSGGLRIFVNLIYRSYEVFEPISSLNDLLKLESLINNLPVFIKLLSEILINAFYLALPFLIIYLIIDIFVSFFGKIIPSLQIQQESFLVKTLTIFIFVFLLTKLDLSSNVNRFLMLYPKWILEHG